MCFELNVIFFSSSLYSHMSLTYVRKVSFELNCIYRLYSAGAVLTSFRGQFVYLHSNTTLSPNQGTNSLIRQSNTSVHPKVVSFFPSGVLGHSSFQEHLSLSNTTNHTAPQRSLKR